MLVFAKTSSSSENAYRLLCLDEKTLRIKWEIPAFQVDGEHSDRVLANEKEIYFAKKNQLLAIKRDSGSISWQASLQDEVTASCNNCFRLKEEQILVLTKDGSLQNFSIKDGKRNWSIHLDAENSHQLEVYGNQILVVDDKSSKYGTRIVKSFDSVTGRLMHMYPQGKLSAIAKEHVSFDLPFVLDSKNANVYLFFGFAGMKGVQKWNLDTQELIWESPFLDRLAQSSFEHSFRNLPFLTEDLIVFSNGLALITIEKKTGQVKTISFAESYHGELISISKNVALLHMIRKRGTERHEICRAYA